MNHIQLLQEDLRWQEEFISELAKEDREFANYILEGMATGDPEVLELLEQAGLFNAIGQGARFGDKVGKGLGLSGKVSDFLTLRTPFKVAGGLAGGGIYAAKKLVGAGGSKPEKPAKPGVGERIKGAVEALKGNLPAGGGAAAASASSSSSSGGGGGGGGGGGNGPITINVQGGNQTVNQSQSNRQTQQQAQQQAQQQRQGGAGGSMSTRTSTRSSGGSSTPTPPPPPPAGGTSTPSGGSSRKPKQPAGGSTPAGGGSTPAGGGSTPSGGSSTPVKPSKDQIEKFKNRTSGSRADRLSAYAEKAKAATPVKPEVKKEVPAPSMEKGFSSLQGRIQAKVNNMGTAAKALKDTGGMAAGTPGRTETNMAAATTSGSPGRMADATTNTFMNRVKNMAGKIKGALTSAGSPFGSRKRPGADSPDAQRVTAAAQARNTDPNRPMSAADKKRLAGASVGREGTRIAAEADKKRLAGASIGREATATAIRNADARAEKATVGRSATNIAARGVKASPESTEKASVVSGAMRDTGVSGKDAASRLKPSANKGFGSMAMGNFRWSDNPPSDVDIKSSTMVGRKPVSKQLGTLAPKLPAANRPQLPAGRLEGQNQEGGMGEGEKGAAGKQGNLFGSHSYLSSVRAARTKAARTKAAKKGK